MTDEAPFGQRGQSPAGGPTAHSASTAAAASAGRPDDDQSHGEQSDASPAPGEKPDSDQSGGDQPGDEQPARHSAPTDWAAWSSVDEPAHLVGYGPIPAGLARDLIRCSNMPITYRRLYLDPITGALATMDSDRRKFDGAMLDAITVGAPDRDPEAPANRS